MWNSLFRGKQKAESNRIDLDSIPTPEEFVTWAIEQKRALLDRISDLYNEATLPPEQQLALKERWRALLKAEMAFLTPEEQRAVTDQAKALRGLPPEQRRAVLGLMKKK